MQCLPYARDRWKEITTKTWNPNGAAINVPMDLWNNWPTSRRGTSFPTNLPAVAIYSSSTTVGHVGIIESKSGSDYTYSDANYDNNGSTRTLTLTQSGIEDLFNTMSIHGYVY